MMIPDTLHHTLRSLRLSGLQQTLDVRLQEAGASQLTHLEFLELLRDGLFCQREINNYRRCFERLWCI